jgi:hypothetical protein
MSVKCLSVEPAPVTFTSTFSTITARRHHGDHDG